MEKKIEFSDIIKELRKDKGYTQYGLALQLGTTENCVRNWEKGRSEADTAMLKSIADLFDVSVDYLIGRNMEIFQEYEVSTEEYQRFKKERKLSEVQLAELDQFIDFLLQNKK